MWKRRVRTSVSFALLALALPAQPAFDALAAKAAAARDSDRVDEAVRLYRECLRQRPQWPEGLWSLATLLYDKSDYAAAQPLLAQFVKLQPKAVPGLALLGLSEFENRNYAPSLNHLQQSLQLGLEGDVRLVRSVRYHTGLLLTRSGHFELAQQRLAEVAMQGEHDPQLVLAAGLAALRIPAFPDALPQSQRDKVERAGRGLCFAAARKPAEAQAEFAALVERYPNEPEVHNAYGTLLISSDADAALRQWRREIEVSPRHVPARLQIAFELLKRGDASAALPYAQQAVQLEPSLFVAHNALGRALAETGDLAQGIRELERARDLAPDSAETRLALASVYARAGRKADADRERQAFQKLK